MRFPLRRFLGPGLLGFGPRIPPPSPSKGIVYDAAPDAGSDSGRVVNPAFLRFDSRVTSDDQFLNARDMFTMRRNYNALLARRIRAPLLQMDFGGVAADLGGELVQSGSMGGNALLDVFVLAPAFSPSLMVEIYGASNSVASSIKLRAYTRVDKASGTVRMDSAVYTWSGGTTNGRVALTVPKAVDLDAYLPIVRCRLVVLVEAVLAGTNLGSNESVILATANTVETAAASPGFSVGDFLYVTTNEQITPRMCVEASDMGSTSQYIVSPPWNIRPVSDNNINAQTLVTFVPKQISVYANPAVSFT